MTGESSSSARSSAPTSSSAAKNQPHSKPGESRGGSGGAALSEGDFLARQQTDAKAAIQRVAGDIASDIGRSVDPRGWMQAAPWTTLAAAALVGFAGTALVVPSKEEQALRRLRRLEKALRETDENRRRQNGNGRSGDDHGRDGADDEQERSRGRSILGTLLGHAVQILKPAISSAISAAVAAHTVQPPAPAAGSGDQNPANPAANGPTSDIP